MLKTDLEIFFSNIQRYEGFSEDSGCLFHDVNKLLEFFEDGGIYVSYLLSCDQLYRNCVSLVENCIPSNSIGNFALLEDIYTLGDDKVVLSDMHYSRLLASSDGYYVEGKSGDVDFAGLYACLGVCSRVPWAVISEKVEGVL